MTDNSGYHFFNSTTKLHVENIPQHTSWEDIKRLFSSFGNILHCEKGFVNSKGFLDVFITYNTEEEAKEAFIQINGYELNGHLLKVSMMPHKSRSQSPKDAFQNVLSENIKTTFSSTDFPLRMLVLSDMVGAIMGRSGNTIRQITQQAKARVDVHRKEKSENLSKYETQSFQVITIYGSPKNCSAACMKILEVIQQEAEKLNLGLIPLKILAHNNLIGRIIGKNGNTIKHIMENTDTKIRVSSINDINNYNLERIITIKGTIENMSKAENMISNKLRQGYEEDLAVMAPQTYMYPYTYSNLTPGYDNLFVATYKNSYFPNMPYGINNNPLLNLYNAFLPYSFKASTPDLYFKKECVCLYIPNLTVGAVIGIGGNSIREIINYSGANIKIAQIKKDEIIDTKGERKITIIGNIESQFKAQSMIFRKVYYETYARPHDFCLRVEIYVNSKQVGRIIGKGGQMVREIQRLSRATIRFPNDNDNSVDEEIPVQIIGDFYSSQLAQHHIRLLLNRNKLSGSNASNSLPISQRQIATI